jgi:hypothetical protein
MPSDLNPQPLPPRAVSIYASRDVMWDINKFQKALASVLERAGHTGCTSGLQLDWKQFEQFVINDKLQAVPFAGERTIGLGG